MGRLLLAQNALLPPDYATLPIWLRAIRRILIIGMPRFDTTQRHEAFSNYIQKLGPGYIKLGQFLSTRPDIIGANAAADLQQLQDRLPPFEQKHAQATLINALGDAASQIATLDAPIAAASIAQVHKTTLAEQPHKQIAVKILRPNIETICGRELSAMHGVAILAERFFPTVRRLRPVAAIETLEQTVALELDLRLEAAALSEMAENSQNDAGFRVPKPIWPCVARRVLTLEWVDGIAASDLDALRAHNHNLPELAVRLIRIFLTHALRDGFFHADMHQGNLLIAEDGTIVAIDLGITGRLDKASRRFLAEILYGFITRDYHKVAQVHFEAGYVPPRQSRAAFAQALRAIGEPIRDSAAAEISMARLLTQLFEVTAQFEMETQLQLLFLQKTMVTVEGVARSFDPHFNMWDAAAPVVRKWLMAVAAPEVVMRDALEDTRNVVVALGRLPETIDNWCAQQAVSPPPMRDRGARAVIALLFALLLVMVGIMFGGR